MVKHSLISAQNSESGHRSERTIPQQPYFHSGGHATAQRRELATKFNGTGSLTARARRPELAANTARLCGSGRPSMAKRVLAVQGKAACLCDNPACTQCNCRRQGDAEICNPMWVVELAWTGTTVVTDTECAWSQIAAGAIHRCMQQSVQAGTGTHAAVGTCRSGAEAGGGQLVSCS